MGDMGMDDFWLLPYAFQAAVFGAAGGVVGVLIANLYRRMSGRPKDSGLTAAISVACVALAVVLGNDVAAPYRQAAIVDAAMRDIKRNALFDALFTYHPGSEAELRTSLAEMLKTTPPDQIRAASAAISSKIVDKYLSHDLLYAPDSAVHALLAEDLVILQTRLQYHPQACVDDYIGKPMTDPTLLTPQDLTAMSSRKADIISGAALNPSPPPAHPDVRAAVIRLAASFRANGEDPRDLLLLGKIRYLPPVRGCGLAIEFTGALASMSDQDASTVFKSLLEAAASRKDAPQ